MKGGRQVIGVILAWVAIYALFAALAPAFRDPSNIEVMMRQSIVDGLGAIGMTYVIVTGGIDLSAGSIIALGTVIGALTLKATHNVEYAIGATLLSGLLAGLLNGLMVARLKVGAFIVTLATMLAIRGLAKGLAHEQTVSSVPQTWLNTLTAALGPGEKWIFFPRGAWVWIFFLGLMGWAMQYTTFGRNTIAIGSNESTARLCGVRVDWVKVGAYGLAGFFFGMGGLMQMSRTGIGDPTIAMGEELKIIAAVVIGGASLSGGEGSVLGAAFGALIMTTINMGCNIMGIPPWVQEILTGAIILVAVGIDRWRLAKSAGATG